MKKTLNCSKSLTIDELKTWSSQQLNDLSYQIRMDDILERTSNDPNYEKEWEDVYIIDELVEEKEMEEQRDQLNRLDELVKEKEMEESK